MFHTILEIIRIFFPNLKLQLMFFVCLFVFYEIQVNNSENLEIK